MSQKIQLSIHHTVFAGLVVLLLTACSPGQAIGSNPIDTERPTVTAVASTTSITEDIITQIPATATTEPEEENYEPRCTISPPAYQEEIPEDKFRISFDVSSRHAEDEISVYINEEEISRCENVVSHPIIGAGQLFSIFVPAGLLTVRFENKDVNNVETLELDIAQEMWVFAGYHAGSDNVLAWHIWVQDYQPEYE